MLWQIHKDSGKKNLTISLDRKTIQKANMIAARRSTSIGALLARQIEILAFEQESYERSQHEALKLLDHGFHLGGGTRAGRDDLHER
jgi:hypothetical protein